MPTTGPARQGRRHVAQFVVTYNETERGGYTIEQKRGLVKDSTDAVVRNFSVAADVVVVQIVESAKDSKAKGGVLFSER